jgi:hypothetical protein
MLLRLLVVSLLFSFTACSQQQEVETVAQKETAMPPKKKRPLAIDRGRFLEKDGQALLYGGKDKAQYFKIDNLILKPEQFHFGIGREHFPALLEPAFVTADEANAWLEDSDRVLGLKIGDVVKAYPIKLVRKHEVVNDVVDGEPIFAAFCVLANLGAIYDRRIAGRVHTFALSGYTYFDPEVWDGLDGFVMWDRETESLWWPPIGKAVSGPLLHTPMKVYDDKSWSQTTWGEWKSKYPSSLVLERDQDFERPTNWPKFDIQSAKKLVNAGDSVALRWGENTEK